MDLILASTSPRRRQLLAEAGYRFTIVRPYEFAECGLCSRESPPELVARLALQKAADVAARTERGLVLACDTVAACCGRVMSKPADELQAREMLEMLSGREHHVYSGVCLWPRPEGLPKVEVDCTTLRMIEIPPAELDEYLASGLWEGKAGAFGFQDRLGWLSIVSGSETNVVGLPMELLARMLAEFPA